MNALDSVPLWIAIPVAVFVMLGATVTLVGAFGLLRLGSFYDRLHSPALGTSWGTGGVVLASIILASYLHDRIVLHEVVVALGVMVTAPVTLMLLGRAALHRDCSEESSEIPEWLRKLRNEALDDEEHDGK